MALGRKELEEKASLAVELAGIRAEIKALRNERDRTAELNDLKDDVDRLKREKDRLVEDNARSIRETEHKVGLVKDKQTQDAKHQKRQIELAQQEAVLKVREENLDADKARFEAEMAFQREHFDQFAERLDGLLKALLERLPTIEVELTGPASTRKKATE